MLRRLLKKNLEDGINYRTKFCDANFLFFFEKS